MYIHDATEQAYKNGYKKGYSDGTTDATTTIYAKWIDGKFAPCCAHCGEQCLFTPQGAPCKSKRCPNCGAVMKNA